MQRLVSALAALAWLMLSGACASAPADAPLTRALETVRADPDMPFQLQVTCTDKVRSRSLEVIRGLVAVWGNEHQVRLSAEDRGTLIQMLVDADFARFKPRYGETPKADKQEAPLRVSCRIHVALRGVEHTSVQLLNGQQSEELLGLAGRLLDQIQPLAAAGVSATNIEDGLAKLGDGVLAPEVLRLRLLTLPDAAGERAGSILRIEASTVSRQPYTPGESVGEIRSREMSPNEMQGIVAALRDASFQDLPLNLQANELTELELSVLGRRKTVVARSSFKQASMQAQEDFDDLLKRLERL